MPRNEKATDQSTRLGFLGMAEFENGNALRGAILITDAETKPFEFRITSPVRPNSYQRALYGSTLEDYVQLELIGVPLIRELRESVDVIVVVIPSLLRIRPKIPVPVALISGGPTELPKRADDQAPVRRLLTFTTHKDYPAEDAVVRSLLMPINDQHDLFEPFERIQVALAEAHKQKVGEAAK